LLIIHHIAIGTPHLLEMVEFYSLLPGLKFLEWKLDENKEKRSAWIDAGGILLMIEKRSYKKGPEAIVFSIQCITESNFKNLPPILSKTDYTIYLEDYDGNKVGYSSFPEKWNLAFDL
jgi:hypothetical protein